MRRLLTYIINDDWQYVMPCRACSQMVASKRRYPHWVEEDRVGYWKCMDNTRWYREGYAWKQMP